MKTFRAAVATKTVFVRDAKTNTSTHSISATNVGEVVEVQKTISLRLALKSLQLGCGLSSIHRLLHTYGIGLGCSSAIKSAHNHTGRRCF